MRTASALTLVAALALGVAAPASAQDDDESCHWDRSSRTMVCGVVDVEGRGSPSAFMLLGRTRDRHDARPLERELVREIPRTVRHAPF